MGPEFLEFRLGDGKVMLSPSCGCLRCTGLLLQPEDKHLPPKPYGRMLPAEVEGGVAIVTGTVAANGAGLVFVTTASTV